MYNNLTLLGSALPRKVLMYSNALSGLSGDSYKFTSNFVSWSITPAFSKYF